MSFDFLSYERQRYYAQQKKQEDYMREMTHKVVNYPPLSGQAAMQQVPQPQQPKHNPKILLLLPKKGK